MKDEILREKLKNLSPKQESLINIYMENDMKKLKKITYHTFKGFNIPNSEHDELYDKAMDILMKSVVSYDENSEANFNTFLIGNLKRKVSTWYRDNYQRGKRKNLLRDENGNIVYEIDSNGKKTPVIISDISFDTPTSDEDVDLKEKIASDFNLEDEIYQDDDKVKVFLKNLSNTQSDMLKLLMDGYSADEVKDKLLLSDREYIREMNSIRANKNLLTFSKNKNDGNYRMEEENMDRVIKISEAEDYRTDKFSLFSLLQDKKNGDINCTYILQREPFQWSEEEANRYFCRVLSNLPIPEIVLCEQKVKGVKINHLIDGLQRLSYAQAYKEGLMKIGKKGAERHLIEYRDYLIDEHGNRILDEDGIPQFETKVFDLIGKYYDDLPNELKRRFNNFNINVTKFFDCTDEQIADHLRDYNNHASMNKEQIGIAKISAKTAQYIKDISKKNTFFKNCKGFTDNSQIKGKVDRVVAEAIMLLFHREDWRANLESTYKYVDENATEREFLYLNSQFNRLELALGDKNKDLEKLFTPTSMPMWIAVFDKFTTYNMEDSCFIEFLSKFNNDLKDKFADNFKNQQSKKKATIIGKVELLIQLMNEYLHIDAVEVENTKTEDTLLDFVKENANPEATDNDIDECYELIDYAKNKLHGFNKESELLDYHNENALIAIFAYALKNNIDLDQWLVKVSNQKNVYSKNQKENYIYMINSLNDYVQASA